MSTPKIAIVIPVFDHAKELETTLLALRAQTYKNIEVVVVDDGSHDAPNEIITKFKDLLITFVSWTENRGAPAARNEGARRTTTPYLLFLDADVSLLPDALAHMVDALETHTDADFVYGNFYWGSKAFMGKPFDVDALKRTNYIHTSSLLRRSAFSGFDEKLKRFQDWDLWLTMSEKGSRGVWIDEFLFTVEPRKAGGMSAWIPSFMFKIPWDKIGWMPQAVKKYREAEAIIKQKYQL